MATKPPPRRLPPAPDKYDRQDQQELRNRIEAMDSENAKVRSDIAMVPNAGQIVYDTDGTYRRWRITVNNGVLTPVLVT